jgi:hypothetical protein
VPRTVVPEPEVKTPALADAAVATAG